MASGGDVPFAQLLNEPTYKYTLIASKAMTDIVIHCPPTSATTSTVPVEAHTYPFRSLPIITSHVHPCFVICHVGRIFADSTYLRMLLDYKRNNEDFKLVFMECLRRYNKWIGCVIPLDSPFYGLLKTSEMDFAIRYGLTPLLGRLDRTSHVNAVRWRNKRRTVQEHIARYSSSHRRQKPEEDDEFLDVTDFVHGWVASIQGQTFTAADNPV
ncbi:hypothetical protein DXG03_002263 [Asterophora parasitica]|uniref:Uncharacterized protein n=1 Tax=Asterophora parasitica TaxID=117018 RepID=A0A9P7FZD7_9AGAR|nr:hypothetical protein DXG03_002263 [Asterophora parasitica]